SRLSYAYGADYTSQAAINSIVGISQATANAYIQRGTNAALSVGSSWGCSPGALTNQAVATFASDVNATKNSVNAQISSVKANKQTQHNAWVEEQARLVALAQILEAAVALAGGSASPEDITAKLIAFMKDAEGKHDEISHYFDSALTWVPPWIMSIGYFISLVKGGGEYDLKKDNGEWPVFIAPGSDVYMTYSFDSEIVRGDAPANILYGYVGKTFGVPEPLLYIGPGIAQIADGTSSWDYIGSNFDDPVDQYYIEVGINYYNRTH
ncbi:MAG: hypothetical protein LBC35_03660, partial [Coriobacteriales bacterium]|nr:hypothetical protein [Coriobacteriales bacterium]